MNTLTITAAVAGVLAAAGPGLAPSAVAAPSGPPSVAQAVSRLRAQGYKVIVNSVGAASLGNCTTYSARPGQTYWRTDSGVPGAGNDNITEVVSKTVFVDTNC